MKGLTRRKWMIKDKRKEIGRRYKRQKRMNNFAKEVKETGKRVKKIRRKGNIGIKFETMNENQNTF